LAFVFYNFHWNSQLDLQAPFGSSFPAACPFLGNHIFSIYLLLHLASYSDLRRDERLLPLHSAGIREIILLIWLFNELIFLSLYIQIVVGVMHTVLEPIYIAMEYRKMFLKRPSVLHQPPTSNLLN